MVEYVPHRHATHEDGSGAPGSVQYLPRGQFSQFDSDWLPIQVEYLPGAHDTQEMSEAPSVLAK